MRCKWVSRGTLGAENDRQRGVRRLLCRFGGVDHDAEVVGGHDERVAVQRDAADVGVIDDLVSAEVLVRPRGAGFPELRRTLGSPECAGCFWTAPMTRHIRSPTSHRPSPS